MNAARWGLLPLLTATLTTTMANTVVNVPMTSILAELHAPLSRGVLVATAFPVTLAALMPLSGWLGDRFGHRRVLSAAMLCMVVGAAGAALAPNLPVLVAFRMVQGLAAAPVLPGVMVLVVQVLGEERRGRAMSLWAAANGAGQALGPTTGGLLSELFGWRAVFWQIVPLAALVVLGGRLLLPADDRTVPRLRLDWSGALTITGAAALFLVSMSAVPSQGWARPWCGGRPWPGCSRWSRSSLSSAGGPRRSCVLVSCWSCVICGHRLPPGRRCSRWGRCCWLRPRTLSAPWGWRSPPRVWPCWRCRSPWWAWLRPPDGPPSASVGGR
ncbi:MFS transporter [Streptomyces malaysiensis subsp. malaysiensis]|nr:MFS transporter [Streptomyces sp. HNM0561]UHH14993.1 MFS transporter [Streptomyces sp. HNM0561]